MRVLFALDLDEPAPGQQDLLTLACALLGRIATTVDLLFIDTGHGPADTRDEGFAPVLASVGRNPHHVSPGPSAPITRADHLERLLGLFPAERRGRAMVVDARSPADEIVRRASTGIDAVALGTHARGGPLRLWLGSVAEKVVRSCPVPVLVLKGSPPATDARVLAAIDLHHAPEHILGEAARWAGLLGVKADGIHVVAGPDPVLAPGQPDGAAEHAEIRHIGERLVALLEPMPPEVRGEAQVGRGPAGAVVADAAATYALVVVGTHGRRGMAHLLLGSVAERIVRTTPVSVLVVPGQA